MDSLKRCLRCQRDLPIGEYHKNARRSDRLNQYCKLCVREQFLRRKQRDPDAIREQGKLRSRKRYSRTQYAWLAGILDFSGNLRLRENNQPELRVFGPKGPLEVIRKFAGCGTIALHSGETYRWTVYRKADLLQLLDLILPTLKLQREHFAAVKKALDPA